MRVASLLVSKITLIVGVTGGFQIRSAKPRPRR
jgi:hypothetical protein